jgi:hypothetical protein
MTLGRFMGTVRWARAQNRQLSGVKLMFRSGILIVADQPTHLLGLPGPSGHMRVCEDSSGSTIPFRS